MVTKAELIELAEVYGLDTDGTKADLEARIAEYEGVELPKSPDEEAEEDTELMLIKMKGNNRRVDKLGYRFTREHPYQAVPEAVAERILESDPDRFVRAKPSEVKSYYS